MPQVREGRSQRSKIVKNSANPVFNEEFFLLVDDFDKQKLSVKVRQARAPAAGGVLYQSTLTAMLHSPPLACVLSLEHSRADSCPCCCSHPGV